MHVCGGKGVCGTCRLEVLEGAEGLSGVTDPERKHLAELLGSGWRLACQAKASAPARFRVPPVKDEGEDEA
jgi:chlorosome envelope protein X